MIAARRANRMARKHKRTNRSVSINLVSLMDIFTILVFQPNAFCGETDEIFTVFLVRHAEKATVSDHSKDPALSPCGESRAVALAEQLQSALRTKTAKLTTQQKLARLPLPVLKRPLPWFLAPQSSRPTPVA